MLHLPLVELPYRVIFFKDTQSIMSRLTHWSKDATLTPYLDTPRIISSSPGTNGSFPSCFRENTEVSKN